MNKPWLFTKVGGATLIGIFAVTYSVIATLFVGVPFWSVLLASTLTFILFASNLKLIKERKYAYIFFAITIIKLVLLVLNAKYKIPFMAGVDWVNYHNYALEAISGGDGIVDIFNNSLDFFVFIMALIYKVFGANAEQIYFYIFPLSLLMVRYVHKTVLLLSKKQKSADRSSVMMAAWPVDIIFSLALLREIPIQLLVIASFFNFLKYHFYKKTGNLLLAFGLIILAALTHSGMIGIFVVYLYALVQDRLYGKYRFVRVAGLVVAALAVLVISFTPLWDSMSKRFTSTSSENGVVTALENQDKYLGAAATNYISSAPQDTVGVITSIPYRFAMFTLSPLPWQVHNFGTILSFVMDGVLQLLVVYALIRLYRGREWLSKKLRNIGTLIMMCIVATYLIFSLGTSNYGTAMRHRAKIAPLVVVLLTAYEIKRRQTS